MKLETPRLELVLLTCSQLGLWLNDLPRLERQLMCTYRAEPLTDCFCGIIAGQKAAVEADDAFPQWHSFWFIVRKTDRTAIGSAVFKGRPDAQGEVEIGYGLGKEFERRGYMTEAVEALCAWALRQQDVRHVVAQTDAHNAASQRVLQRCGFTVCGRGETIRWRL